MKKGLFLLIIFISFSYALNGAKYLIITHDNFYDAILPLAQWKHKKGVPTKVVRLSELNATPESIAAIKRYIVNAYNTWNPRPEYILLVGSPTYIKADNNTYDDFYGNMSGDYLMELPVGRFTCTNISECSLMVTKTLGYERTPFIADTTWFRKGSVIVNIDNDPVDDSIYWADGRYCMAQMINAGYKQVDSFSDAPGFSHTYVDVENAITEGRTYVVYRGYWGSGPTWANPFNVDPARTNNGFKLPIIVSGTCTNMSLSGNTYLGEKFLRAGTVSNPKGAVGYFGTTQAASEVARFRGAVAKGFFRALFEEKNYFLGPITKRAKFILDSLYRGQTGYSTTRYREWNLLGDPELNLWTNTPRQLTVLHDTIIYTGPQTYSVTVKIGSVLVPNALVCLMMNDSIVYEYGYTNSSGVISFSINPLTPGIMSVTVTGLNCIPYEKNVTVQLGGDAHDVGVLAILEPTGIIASGSSVYPKVLIKNYGTHTDTFPVTFKIGSVYTQTINQVILGPGDTVTKQFPVWNATLGTYSVKAYTALNIDQWRANDTALGNLNVVYGKDVGIDSILSPDTFHILNTGMTPQVKVKNYGAIAQSNFPVVCSIVSITGSVRYTNTQIISLDVQRDTIVNFASWIPTISEKCCVKFGTALVGDTNSANDRKTRFTDILPISQIVIGNGTATSRFPLDRYYNYSVHEAIYLQSEINTAGNITHIAYYKASGDDVNPIENVLIYMKHTQATTLATGTYSLDGYTLVFSGSFTNNATSGWMEVPLTTPFYYNNSDNLQILIRKGYQQWINNYPQWRYTSTSPNYRTRQAYSDDGEPTNLNQTYNRPNIRLTLTTIRDVGIMAIISPTEVVADSQLITPKAIVKNLSYKPETLSVTFNIGNDYSNTITNFILNAGATDTAIFSTNWLATIGTYTTKCYVVNNIDFNPFNDTIQSLVTCRESYEHNFETTNGSFSASPSAGGWEWGVPTSGPNSAHSGTKLWATVLAGNYANNANWKLVSSEFIATSNNPQLKFWHWYNMEESQTIPGRAYDGGNVKISTDSGLTWNLIRPINGYNGVGYITNAGIAGESCFTGVHETWQQATFNLPVVSGQRFMVCWHFGSDGGIVRSGWYLDDIICTDVVSSYPNDVGCISIQAPISPVDSGAVITPSAIIHNYSLNRLSFDVKFDISDGYSNTRSVSAPPNLDTTISFSPWTASQFGTFVMKCSTSFTLDENSFNDKVTGNVSVRFHDVGAYEIVSPKDTQFAGNLSVSAKFKNYYTRTASCSTKFVIRDAGSNIIFNQSRYLSNLLPDSVRTIDFGNFNALPGKYYAQTYTILNTDDNASNDTISDSVYVVLSAPILTTPSPSETLNTSTPSFDWQDVYGATEYQMQIADTNDFSSLLVDTIVSNSAYQHLTLMNNGRYYWRVRAGVPYSYWSEIRMFVISPSVTLISPLPNEILSTRTPFFDWQDVENATEYEIQIDETQKFSSPIDTIVYISEYQMPSPGLNEGTYFWRVRAGLPYGQWSEVRRFTIEVVQPGWQRKNPIPTNVSGKGVKDGGAMVAVNSWIYALRGNKSNEFYMFNGTNWVSKESVPFGKKPLDPTKYNIKRVGKGSALCFDGANKIYATKGNRTQEFWAYDILENRWVSKVFIPIEKGAKGGTSLVFYEGKVYMLLGGRKYGETNFFVYDTMLNQWNSLNSPPIPDGKPYKDGSCLVLFRDTIFALKGSGKDNYFFAYDIQTNTWSQRKTLPLIHPQINKEKKVKDGGAMTTDQNVIYTIKGGGAQDFWQYLPGANNWIHLNAIPKIDNKSIPKTGASLAYANGRVYLLKGNNTTEFWQYTPMPKELSQPEPTTNTSLMTEKSINISGFNFNITPSLIYDYAKIQFSIPSASRVQIKLYNSTGQMIETILDGYFDAGIYAIRYSLSKLSQGIYFINYNDLTNNKTLVRKILKTNIHKN